MNQFKLALLGAIIAFQAAVSLAASPLAGASQAGAFGGPMPYPDRRSGAGIVLAQAAPPKASDFGGRKPNLEKDAAQKKIDAALAKKLRAAKLAEIKKKLTNISLLIQSVNVRLDLMTAKKGEFEQKRSLENQLRDLITLFAMTDRAIREAGRLTREVFDIRKNARKGLKDPRRLTLANFLEARRREYIRFATR